MKKSLSIIIVALCTFVTVSAQDAKAIFDKYVELTKVESFVENYGDASTLFEMNLVMGPMTMPIKVISNGDDCYRMEMEAQGQNILAIVRDTTAWVTVQGQTQMITGEDAMKQLVPIKNFVEEMVPSAEDYENFTYIAKEGKGRNECDVIEVTIKESGMIQRMYFSTKTGLLTKSVAIIMDGDTKHEIATEFGKHVEMADGELFFPSKLTTKTPEGNIVFETTNFEVEYPTAPWMFAAPKM